MLEIDEIEQIIESQEKSGESESYLLTPPRHPGSKKLRHAIRVLWVYRPNAEVTVGVGAETRQTASRLLETFSVTLAAV